jgi:hypothetical protein
MYSLSRKQTLRNLAYLVKYHTDQVLNIQTLCLNCLPIQIQACSLPRKVYLHHPMFPVHHHANCVHKSLFNSAAKQNINILVSFREDAAYVIPYCYVTSLGFFVQCLS